MKQRWNQIEDSRPSRIPARKEAACRSSQGRPSRRSGSTREHRAHLFRGVEENHQPKYAAAVLEDARLADARWRWALLAPGVEYLPTGETGTTEVGARAGELADRLSG